MILPLGCCATALLGLGHGLCFGVVVFLRCWACFPVAFVWLGRCLVAFLLTGRLSLFGTPEAPVFGYCGTHGDLRNGPTLLNSRSFSFTLVQYSSSLGA